LLRCIGCEGEGPEAVVVGALGVAVCGLAGVLRASVACHKVFRFFRGSCEAGFPGFCLFVRRCEARVEGEGPEVVVGTL